jgi:hypothetical protein
MHGALLRVRYTLPACGCVHMCIAVGTDTWTLLLPWANALCCWVPPCPTSLAPRNQTPVRRCTPPLHPWHPCVWCARSTSADPFPELTDAQIARIQKAAKILDPEVRKLKQAGRRPAL